MTQRKEVFDDLKKTKTVVDVNQAGRGYKMIYKECELHQSIVRQVVKQFHYYLFEEWLINQIDNKNNIC